MLNFGQMLQETGRQILVVGLNPCLDVTLTVPDLQSGKTNYYTEYREDLGGKGCNVIRALHGMGGSGRLFSPDFPDDGLKVQGLMRKEGIPSYLVNLPGDLRINYKVMEPRGENEPARMTELNGRGQPASEAAYRVLEREWVRQIEDDQLLVLSGSLLPGLPEATYRELIENQHRQGGRVVLDAAGESLRLALEAGPDLVKPNRDELSEVTGMRTGTIDEAVRAARRLVEMGADVVLASLAEDGAILTRKGAVFWAPAPPNPKIRRLAGAGDAMTAVLAAFASRDDDLTDDELPDVLIWAMAASQAAISHNRTEMPGLEEVAAWTDKIEVRRIG